MFFLIDKEFMRLIRVHHDRLVLGDLACIECANVPSIVMEFTPGKLAHEFSDWDLKRLYKAITGTELKTYFSDAIAHAVYKVLAELPEDDIDAKAADLQAKYASQFSLNDDGETINYRYRPGAHIPETLLQVAIPLARSTNRFLSEAELAGLPHTATLRELPKPAPGSAAPAPSAPKPAPTSSEPSVAHVATRGASVTVFAVADEMWAKAGKPMDASVVLTLRRTIMDELEKEYGIKRTTSSTALGQWQKVRLTQV